MASRGGILACLLGGRIGDPPGTVLELLGLGAELSASSGRQLQAAAVGASEEEARRLGEAGAEAVFLAEVPGADGDDATSLAAALVAVAAEAGPAVILLGHTPLGQDVAARLGHSLSAATVTDAVRLEMREGRLLCTKPVYGGNALATFAPRTDAAVVTVRAGAGKSPEPRAGISPEVLKVEPERPSSCAALMERVREEGEEVRLEEARFVVSGGRGMGGPEGFEILRELARLLRGAVGASRPPVDAGWFPSTAQVGITGRIVAPEVYMAVAISGSSQHLSGMGDSRVIVAVNKDPEAYIFKVSDYGVVGEWQQVMPAFTARLRELLEG